ncbi:MAG: lysozyme [Melioribacteraceae bacterium]
MKTSENGIAIIKKYEGLRLQAYRCPAGLLTIGYGHTKTTKPGMVINKEMAELLLKQDLIEYEKAVNELVKVPLTQNQFDALISFIFNVGIGNFKKSTLLKKLNEWDYNGAAEEFMKWTKAKVEGGYKELPGLVKRRNEEKQLFLKA